MNQSLFRILLVVWVIGLILILSPVSLPLIQPNPGKVDILIVYEIEEPSGQLTSEQEGYLFGKDFQSDKEKFVSDFRILDQNTPIGDEAPKWKKALDRPRTSLPWIILSNGTSGTEGPLPENKSSIRSLIEDSYKGVWRGKRI